MDGLRVAQRAPLGHLHRVDVADQVGDRGVGCRQLLHISFVAVLPRHREGVAQLGGTADGGVRDGLVGMLGQLGAVDHGRPLVEEPRQRAQEARLALASLAQQDDVVSGDQRALQLRDHRRLEAVQARPRVRPRAQLHQQIVAELGADRLLHMAGCAQLAERRDTWNLSHLIDHPPRVTPRSPDPAGPAKIPESVQNRETSRQCGVRAVDPLVDSRYSRLPWSAPS